MAGLLVFPSMEKAVEAGFHMYDRCADGRYLVRKRGDSGWMLAIVDRKAK